MLLKQQLGKESIWGSCCSPLPLSPPFHSHSGGGTSITCSGRNPWWASAGNTRQRQQTAVLFLGCYMNYATIQYTVAEEGVWHVATETLLLLGTADKQRSQSVVMVRAADSWRPQSPAVFACVKHDYLVISCVLWLRMEHVHGSISACSAWQSRESWLPQIQEWVQNKSNKQQ